jgi:hypothetical protein
VSATRDALILSGAVACRTSRRDGGELPGAGDALHAFLHLGKLDSRSRDEVPDHRRCRHLAGFCQRADPGSHMHREGGEVIFQQFAGTRSCLGQDKGTDPLRTFCCEQDAYRAGVGLRENHRLV